MCSRLKATSKLKMMAILGFKTLILTAVISSTFAQEFDTAGSPCRVDKYTAAIGQCAAKEKCNLHSLTMDFDGTDVINPRDGNQEITTCRDSSVCCLPINSEVRQKPEGCGWRNPYGVKTEGVIPSEGQALPGEFPWLVNVVKFKHITASGKPKYDYKGDGSLIHEKIVLTAAHILDNSEENWYVVVGDYQLNKKLLEDRSLKVKSIEVHPNYNSTYLYNDLALLYLAIPVPKLPHIGAVCLPPIDFVVPHGTRCIAAGWGRNENDVYRDIVSKVELPAVSNTECQSILRKTDLTHYFQLHENFMCAGATKTTDTCHGGGGSPLICPIAEQPGRYILAGVTSWGYSCGRSDGTPAVYASTARLRGWVDESLTARALSTDSYSRY